MLDIAHYIWLGVGTETGGRYQNFFVGKSDSLGVQNVEDNFLGGSYEFAPFAVSGDVSTQGAEGGEVELLAPANILTGAKMWQSVRERFLVEIATVMLSGSPPQEPDGLPIWTTLGYVSLDYFVCDSLSYTDAVPGETDAVAVFALRLTSPLSVVNGSSPTRRLRADQVGPLPASGGIAF